MYAVDYFPARIIGKSYIILFIIDIIELRKKGIGTSIFGHYAFGKAK